MPAEGITISMPLPGLVPIARTGRVMKEMQGLDCADDIERDARLGCLKAKLGNEKGADLEDVEGIQKIRGHMANRDHRIRTTVVITSDFDKSGASSRYEMMNSFVSPGI